MSLDFLPGDRYRLVSILDGVEHVSSIALGADEVAGHLELEAEWHRLAGWTVTRGEEMVVCRRGDHLRVVEARRYTPLTDVREPARA